MCSTIHYERRYVCHSLPHLQGEVVVGCEAASPSPGGLASPAPHHGQVSRRYYYLMLLANDVYAMREVWCGRSVLLENDGGVMMLPMEEGLVLCRCSVLRVGYGFNVGCWYSCVADVVYVAQRLQHSLLYTCVADAVCVISSVGSWCCMFFDQCAVKALYIVLGAVCVLHIGCNTICCSWKVLLLQCVDNTVCCWLNMVLRSLCFFWVVLTKCVIIVLFVQWSFWWLLAMTSIFSIVCNLDCGC